jgi:hypothetical protein
VAALPIEELPAGVDGHHRPPRTDPTAFKVLFTRAHVHGEPFDPIDLLRRTYRREPLIVVQVKDGTATKTKKPPAHVYRGDIPTPLY